MMKNCGRCERPVYPTEELKCLDKTWHRTCFKCQSCNMTLNMKTYKGFDKLPYCEAHIPKAKATTVSETPEYRRIAENTKLQSQVKYHEDFEKAKGKFTQVADDPETLRIKANTKIISNVAYHGELEKKAIMEQKRSLTGGEDAVSSESPEPKETIPEYQPPLPASAYHNTQTQKPLIDPNANQYTPVKIPVASQQKFSVGSVPSTQNDSPYSARQHSSSTVIYSSQQKEVAPTSKTVGSISDYDPMNDNYGSIAKPYRGTTAPQQQQTSSYGAPQQTRVQGYPSQTQNTQPQPYNNSNSISAQRQPNSYPTQQTPAYQPPAYQPQQAYQQPQYKETAGFQQAYPQSQSLNYSQQPYQQQPQQTYQQQQQTYQQQQQTYQQQQQQYQAYSQAPQQRKPQGQAFRAMYDYDAQDSDEVSFLDGDVILNCTSIDEGWMTGTVKRTAQTGMIPANYVEPIH